MITLSTLLSIMAIWLAMASTGPTAWLLFTLAGFGIVWLVAMIARELGEMTDDDLKEQP